MRTTHGSMVLALFCLVFVCGGVLADEGGPIAITVRVVDGNANAVAGGEVAIYENIYDFETGKEYSKQLAGTLRTNADGRCELTADVRDTRYIFVVVRKDGLAIGWDCLEHTMFENSRADFNIVLEQACTLSGKIVDQKGKAVAGASVQAVPKTSYLHRLRQRAIIAPQGWFTVKTDNNGVFSFDNFAADVSSDFWVKAADRAWVYKFTTYYQTSCGYEVGREGIKLVLPAAVTIEGRVVDAQSGESVDGIDVIIRPSNIRKNINPYVPHQVVCGDEGKFRFDGLPTGEHLVRALVPQERSNTLISKTVKLEVLPDGKPEEIVIELLKAGQLEIEVREATTNEPLENITVAAHQTKSPPETSFRGLKKTNSNGIAIITAPEGKCNVRVWGTGFASSTAQESVTVTAGKKSVKQILLDREPSVSGKVVDETGKPVSGALVRVYPFGGEVITDGTGGFKAIYEEGRGAKMVYARDEGRNLAGIVDKVGDGKSVVITLKPAMKVIGQIVGTDGTGIPAARCWLSIDLPGTLSEVGAEVLTDSQGRYMFTAIALKKEFFDYRLNVAAAGFGPEDYMRVEIMEKSETSGVLETVKLKSANLSLTGIVVDADGEIASGVPIFLHGDGQPDKTTVTDSAGNFVLNRICEGKLNIQANFASDPKGSGRLKAKGGDKGIKVVLGQEGVHTPDVSIRGKALGALSELGIALDAEKTEGKMVLVCFWDMEQRPSRYCIRELAKKAGELEEKGVIVASVETSGGEKETLDGLRRRYKVSFPVGTIKGDKDKTLLSWGVKANPWLILTDRNHDIKAEGFGITELDEKIGDAG